MNTTTKILGDEMQKAARKMDQTRAAGNTAKYAAACKVFRALLTVYMEDVRAGEAA